VGLERWFGKLFVSPQYALQANFPFDYISVTPDLFTLFISYVDLRAFLDLRNNPISPHSGAYLGAEIQYAGGPLQGDATDFKMQPEARGFIPLGRRLTLATRASVGFLFPQNYGAAAQRRYGQSTFDVDDTGRDDQILFFRGFFSGGPSSNRGYPLRGIGPRNPVPFVSPAGQSRAAAGCDPNAPCDLPIGGLSLWEANVELRIVVAGPFSTAVFCDSGDVSPFEVNVRLDRPHLSCGGGARYETPVGPIRLDVGYRIPGLQHPNNAVGEKDPDTLFGVPIALAFGIGEAF
jgi:outer membrane translocation and assembly module TamA